MIREVRMSEAGGNVTLLLDQLSKGNREAINELVPLVYGELRRIAGAYMRREQAGHTLQATGLVNEAYLRLVAGSGGNWQNRAHFFGIAANTMRQILLDHARKKHAEKRGGEEARRVDIDMALLVAEDSLEDVIAVDEVLTRLEKLDARQARLVELRFFGGLGEDEAAEVLGISKSTLKREWRSAKAWLSREMTSI